MIWYVWIGEKLDNASYTTRYIGRYAKRPTISETKIIDYSLEKQIVSYVYKDKISRTFKKATLPVDEFIGKLVRHIPEKNFRMIRYYGFYANRIKGEMGEILEYQTRTLFGEARLLFELKSWRERIKEFACIDPLMCPDCKVLMELKEIAYWARDGTLKTVIIS